VNPYGSSTWQSTDDDMGFEISARYAYVDEDFGEAVDLEMVSGRFFKEEDLNATTPPIIVSKRFLSEHFPGKNMLDSIILFNGEHKIIGIMTDYRYGGIFEEERNTVLFYHPHTNEWANSVILNMAPGTNISYEEKVNKVVEEVTKSTSFVIQHLEDAERRTNSRTWIPMIALLSIAGFLCINVALGLFGVLWYNINKRKAEIGLRRAVGAHTTGIVYQFVMEVLMLTSLGLILGIFFAIQVPLLKIMPLSPWLFYRAIIFAILIIVAIVTICALYPSTQASRIQPSAALHED
jgi:putative ABC transport system permease protein